jgi:hypothetical protein
LSERSMGDFAKTASLSSASCILSNKPLFECLFAA